MDMKQFQVILIDDNEQDIELALYALRRENLGEFVRVIRDGEEALDFIADRARGLEGETVALPKLILLDLKLPKVDGLELLRQIRSNPVTQVIPVVVLSSSVHDKDVVNCYRLGANSYIQKPVNFDEFRQMVKQIGLYWMHTNYVPLPSVPRTEKSNAVF